MAALLLLLHAGCFGWYVFGVSQNLEVTGSDLGHGAHTYGGRWKYLTFINQVLQTVFFGVCVLADLASLCVSSNKRLCSVLLQLRDLIFSVLAFPLGMFVVISFWSIYGYDRELVYPEALDKIIPQWLNHAMHTFVLPILLIELLACSHQYPSRKKGLPILGAFCLSYMFWILWINYASGIWVYPILAKLNAVGMAVFLAVSMLVTVPFYCIGEFLTSLCWGVHKPAKRKRRKNKKAA
ncbi:androgen-induced gene 1 protein-like [Rhinophrynus dorsalis]